MPSRSMTLTDRSLGGSVLAYNNGNLVERHRYSIDARQASVARPCPQYSARRPYINSTSGPSSINRKPQKPTIGASAGSAGEGTRIPQYPMPCCSAVAR